MWDKIKNCVIWVLGFLPTKDVESGCECSSNIGATIKSYTRFIGPTGKSTLKAEWSVYFDGTVSDDAKKAFKQGAKLWTDLVPTLQFRYTTDKNAAQIVVQSIMEKRYGQFSWFSPPRLINIKPGLVHAPLSAHELGHFLGLKHNKDKTSIMSPVVYATRPNKSDVDALTRLLGD